MSVPLGSVSVILPSLSVDLETDTFLPFLSVTVMLVALVLIYPPPPPFPRLPPPPPEDEPPDDLTGSVTLPFASVVPLFSVVLSLMVTDMPFTDLLSLSRTVTVV